MYTVNLLISVMQGHIVVHVSTANVAINSEMVFVKPGMWPARAWFLEIYLVHEVCLCVRP